MSSLSDIYRKIRENRTAIVNGKHSLLDRFSSWHVQLYSISNVRAMKVSRLRIPLKTGSFFTGFTVWSLQHPGFESRIFDLLTSVLPTYHNLLYPRNLDVDSTTVSNTVLDCLLADPLHTSFCKSF